MFTLEQIKHAHGKVLSGADFPTYISTLKALGLTQYELYVSDGHADYFGHKNHKIASAAVYNTLYIASAPDAPQFKAALKAHQQGHTDYQTFCQQAAASGVEKWVVDIAKMTCTYYDKAGNNILEEVIPQ